MGTQSFGESLDRKWSIGVHPAISFSECAPARLEQGFTGFVLRHNAVECCVGHFPLPCYFFSPASSCTSSRISKIEIIGRKRINNIRSQTNRPMVPNKTA